MKKVIFLFSVFLVLCNVELNAQSKNSFQKIVSDEREEGDCFGWSTAINGDYAIVGAMPKQKKIMENTLRDVGAAYIFKKDEKGKWLQMQKLESDIIKEENFFGGSVGINGVYAVVGSSGDDNSKEADVTARMGAAHVYKLYLGKWTRIQRLELAKKEKQDNFGYSVSMSDKYMAVGCPGRNYKGVNFTEPSGAVYVYSLHAKGGWMPMQEILVPADGGFWFGRGVSVSGNNLVVSTANSGAVYVYEVDKAGKWQLKSTLKSTEPSDFGFGGSVSISNTRLLIGAEGDYDAFEGMERPNTDSVMEIMNEEPNGKFSKMIIPNNLRLRDSFGIKPFQFKAMSKPVESLEARKKRMAGAGAAYVYKRNDDGTWVLEERITPKVIIAENHFGSSVSISDSMLVIAAVGDKLPEKTAKDNYYAGAAYVFKLDKNGKWVETKKITATKRIVWSRFGFSVGSSKKSAIIGSRFEPNDAKEKFPVRDGGAAYIYEEK